MALSLLLVTIPTKCVLNIPYNLLLKEIASDVRSGRGPNHVEAFSSVWTLLLAARMHGQRGRTTISTFNFLLRDR